MVVGRVVRKGLGEGVKRSEVTIGRLSERVAAHREERIRGLSRVGGYVIREEC